MKSFYRSLFTLLLTLFAASANAGTGLTGPTSSSTGNYTIASVNNACGQSAVKYHLIENSKTILTSCAISKSFSNKPSGTYIYKLKECEYDSEFGREFCLTGSAHTVVVSTGSGENPNGDNEVRLGHYDNDGRLDIFVASTVSNPYVLRQLSNKSFQLITGLNSSQISAFSNWTLSTGILVHLSDFNADGTDDLMLLGVSSYVAGAYDQIVSSQYAGNPSSHPVSVSAMTPAKQQFLVETLGLSQDPDYLLRTMIEQGSYSFISHGFGFGYFNTAYLQIFQMGHNGSLYVDLNDNPYDSSQSPSNCAIYNCLFDFSTGQWQMYVYAEVIETIFDYSIFNTQTVVLANEMDKVEAGTSTIDNLLNVIESVVGTVSCNGIEASQVDVFDSVHNFSYFKTNTCTFAVLARYLNSFSIKEIIDEGNKRVQFRASKVRAEWWKPFYHGSIRVDTENKWFSGFPNHEQTILLGFDDHPDDHISLTLLAGFITTELNQEVVRSKLESATSSYGNSLKYNYNPLPFTASYNSNSYAQGLVDLIGTVTAIEPLGAPGMNHTIDISINTVRFPGLFKPVPKSEFGF